MIIGSEVSTVDGHNGRYLRNTNRGENEASTKPMLLIDQPQKNQRELV